MMWYIFLDGFGDRFVNVLGMVLGVWVCRLGWFRNCSANENYMFICEDFLNTVFFGIHSTRCLNLKLQRKQHNGVKGVERKREASCESKMTIDVLVVFWLSLAELCMTSLHILYQRAEHLLRIRDAANSDSRRFSSCAMVSVCFYLF